MSAIVLFLSTIVLFFSMGCSTTQDIKPDLAEQAEKINYQKDLKMKIRAWNGKEWGPSKTVYGAGIIPKSTGYKIRVEPPGKADLMTIENCHRELKTPNPKRHGGWFSKKYYEFEIWPTEEHEIEKACSFETGVYEKNEGRHAWGLLVIESERAGLPATLKCNGKVEVFGGTSICQAKKNLIQSIHFDRRVRHAFGMGCELKEPADLRNWVFQIPEGECKVFFVDVENPSNFHKAVFYGYSKIPIRGVE